MGTVIPIKERGRRMAEHGRIRLGKKTTSSRGKVIPTAIDTLRFTSPDKTAIEQLAQLHGGTPRPWTDPKASPSRQFEVITEATEMDVWLVPGGMSQWYELWEGSGCLRRCDGIECEVPDKASRDGAMMTVPCICADKSRLECRPYTRLQLVLPGIQFGGSWRLETKGENAAEELPGMAEMIEQLQVNGQMLEAVLRLESRQSRGGSRKYVVPTLGLKVSPLELMHGGGTVAALSSGAPPTMGVPELAAGKPEVPWDDDEIADAEIVDDVFDLPNAPRDPVELTDRQREGLLSGAAKWSAEVEGKVVKA